MSDLRLTVSGSAPHGSPATRHEQPVPARRGASGGSTVGWLVAGAAVLTAGYFVWRQFEPDFRRYMKMRDM